MSTVTRIFRQMRLHARTLAALAGGLVGPGLIIAIGGRFDLTWLVLLGYILLAVGVLAVLIVGMVAFIEVLVLRLISDEKEDGRVR